MSRESKPTGPKIQRIELSEKNVKLRWILVCVLLAIAVIAILWGIFGSRQKDGWFTVESNATGMHCGDEFLLNFEFGTGEKSATKEQKELTELYTALTEKAWQLFYPEAGESRLGNLWSVNSHPNETVTVDPVLYTAFQVMEEQNSRLHYLGPVYAIYDHVFYSGSEADAAEWDPAQDELSRQFVLDVAQFAADPNAVRLELLPENRVILHVSEEYKTYLAEYMEEIYLDFGWLRNAFIVDYMAGELEKNGFTSCNITSTDGFAKNLDRRGISYSLNLFNLRGENMEQVATMNYTKPTSLVYLRTYGSSKALTFSDGRVVTYMADPTDGQCKAALPNLVSYSGSASCAEIALQIAPTFIADSFTADGLNALTEAEIYSIWCKGLVLNYNQKDLELTLNQESYILSPVNE